MPRRFTEQERSRIRRRLLEAGREAFGLRGIRKTSIDELVKTAGISKGAFYQFFDSKEALYFRLMRETEQIIHSSVMEAVSAEASDSRRQLKAVLLRVTEQVGEDPFFRAILQGREFEYLKTKFSDAQLAEAMAADVELSEALMDVWKKRGCLLVEDEMVVAGVFRAMFMLMLHKDEIGGESFREVMEIMIEAGIGKLISAEAVNNE